MYTLLGQTGYTANPLGKKQLRTFVPDAQELYAWLLRYPLHRVQLGPTLIDSTTTSLETVLRTLKGG